MADEVVPAASAEVATPKPKAVTISISEYVKKNHDSIAAALPNIGLTAEAVARTALSQIYRNPQLALCDHVSIMRAIIEAASLGLSFALGRAYLVPFNNKIKGRDGKPDTWRMEAQFMPGYQGLVDLVRRSASVKTVIAEAVYAGDKFEFRRGLETDHFEHEPLTEPDDAKLTHTYCLIRFNDGGYQVVVLTKQQIDKVRARSKSKDNGPWVTDYSRMAIKTSVKLCTKLCPASIELSRAIELDNDAETGQRQQLSAGAAFGEQPQIGDGVIDAESQPVTQRVSSAAAELLQKVKPTEAQADKPARKAGRPAKCKGPNDCNNVLTDSLEKEFGLCNDCQKRMTQAKRVENGTAVPPPQPLVPLEEINNEEHARLKAFAEKARDTFLADNDNDMVKANKALESLSGGACRNFIALPLFMRENPNFERVIEEAIS